MYTARVAAAPGSGRLVLMATACVFVPAGESPAETEALLAAIERGVAGGDPGSTLRSIGDHVLARSRVAPRFGLVEWSAHGRRRLVLAVRGDLTIVADLGRPTELVGTGSSTWVELRPHTPPDVIEVAVGAPVGRDGGRPVGHGERLVTAGGFTVRLSATDHAPTVSAPEPSPPRATAPGGRPEPGNDPSDHGGPIDATAEPSEGAPGDSSVVEPPVVAAAELDGVIVPLTGVHVFGRDPAPPAAGRFGAGTDLAAAAEVVRLSAPTSVAATHLLLSVERGTIAAVDCGSRTGSALVRSGAEPIALPPWTPHAVQPGDVIYLGGPTRLAIRAAPDGDDRIRTQK